MEKLQKALSQARAHRVDTDQGKTGGSAEVGEHPVAPAQASSEADLWAALVQTEPDPGHLTRNRIVTQSYTNTAMPFDILRTKVLLQMRKNGWKRLAITSATPACGKSTITANMALGLSRQSDLRAVVMELDLRNPSLAKMIGIEPPHDVTKLLSGEASFANQALRLGDTVALSLARRRASDPTRILQSQRTNEIINEIEEAYAPDLMIFDTPPVLVSDDTRAFLGQVDCAMIIARAEQTTIAQIDSCEREIAEQTNVLGVVLNQNRFTDSDAGYGYGYGDYGN